MDKPRCQWLCMLSAAVAPLMALAADPEKVTYQQHQETHRFINEVADNDGFSKQQLNEWFASATKKQSILDAISRPAEKTLTWKEYRKIFVTDSRIDKGIDFWQTHQETLAKAEQDFGVPAEVIVAIIGVETRYGKHKGRYRVIDALSTLAFDYPKRSAFFRKELREFLLLSREQKLDPLEPVGSYAGAMGYGQFIPSSYRAYAIDYDGDEFVDIWNNPVDAIGSVANYFKRHGWRSGEDVTVRTRASRGHDVSILNQSLKPSLTLKVLGESGFSVDDTLAGDRTATVMRLEGRWGSEYWLGLHNFYVITRYNHSRLYAMAVWQLSQEIAKKRS